MIENFNNCLTLHTAIFNHADRNSAVGTCGKPLIYHQPRTACPSIYAGYGSLQSSEWWPTVLVPWRRYGNVLRWLKCEPTKRFNYGRCWPAAVWEFPSSSGRLQGKAPWVQSNNLDQQWCVYINRKKNHVFVETNVFKLIGFAVPRLVGCCMW